MLKQTLAITLLSLRSIPDRLGPSLVIVVGLAGVIVTIVVVVAMILITPHGVERSHRRPETPDDDVAPRTRATEPALSGPVALGEERHPG